MANLTDVLNFRSNLTGADIKSLYEAEFNAFVDSDKSKIDRLYYIPTPTTAANYDATNKDEVGCDSSGIVGVDAEFNTYYGQGLTVAPAITTAIPVALTQVVANKLNTFALTFNEFCTVLSVTAQHRKNWATIAQSFNLPADFVNVVRGGN